MIKDILLHFNDTYDGYHGKSKQVFKKKYPLVYDEILNTFPHLTDLSPYPEVLYCVTNNITEYPKCQNCGNDVIRWNSGKKRYMKYCSTTCSSPHTIKVCHSNANIEKMKVSRKSTLLKKYGVTNASHIPHVKAKISKAVKSYWKGVYESKDFTVNGLTREQYRNRNQQYVETQYARFKAMIDPEGKRGSEWHIDHIYSVSEGFINEVPINVLSDITNLRLIHKNENYKKNRQSHKTLKELYEDYRSREAAMLRSER